jgi:hypothetical protein
MILIKHLKKENQLHASLRQAIKDDNEPYLRNRLSNFISNQSECTKIEEIKYWFGL